MKTTLLSLIGLALASSLTGCASPSPIADNEVDKAIYEPCNRFILGYDESCVRDKMTKHIEEEMAKDPNPVYDRAWLDKGIKTR